MKSTLLILALFIFSTIGYGQISFRTGDTQLEIELNQVNKEAKADMTGFKTELTQLHNIGISQVNDLLKKVTYPAEVLLALRIADIIHRPVNDVMRSYTANRDKGWGAIAKDLGIKPGSPEFHALKGKNKGGSGSHGNSGNKGNSGNNGNKGKK